MPAVREKAQGSHWESNPWPPAHINFTTYAEVYNKASCLHPGLMFHAIVISMCDYSLPNRLLASLLWLAIKLA